MTTTIDLNTATVDEVLLHLLHLTQNLTVENTPEVISEFERVFADNRFEAALPATDELAREMGKLGQELGRGKSSEHIHQVFPFFSQIRSMEERYYRNLNQHYLSNRVVTGRVGQEILQLTRKQSMSSEDILPGNRITVIRSTGVGGGKPQECTFVVKQLETNEVYVGVYHVGDAKIDLTNASAQEAALAAVDRRLYGDLSLDGAARLRAAFNAERAAFEKRQVS